MRTVPALRGFDLRAYGARPAVHAPDGLVTYADLADRVDDRVAALGETRRLILLGGANTLESLVTYLAALAGGHPVILVPGDSQANLAAVVDCYDPDVVAGADGSLQERRPGTRHALHPELALLLSTSGSTGSPKLVRLSMGNIRSNATAIAEYLAIRGDDVAATSLPMHYCYGLSVINSHLVAGAAVMLTDLSVVDTCFWDRFREARATTFAGVPYTFDLLDRVGFAEMDLPSLRYVTQAGGRLAPERVRRYAELGRARGWDLFVMYGQTEATARMAYLPPDLALTSPSSIGVPVPGGAFHIDPEVGELLYQGPNVMLGYAETPADLALGRVTTVLRTGDVARRTPEGLYEIVGRTNRFAKIFGLRIDLDHVERIYAQEGLLVACAVAPGPSGERLVVAVSDEARPVDPVRVQAVARETLGLPPAAVAVRVVRELPRLPNGKPDYQTVARGLEDRPRPAGGPGPRSLCDLYADVLGRDGVTERDSFVSLDGDSLSYVEMSIRLEKALGHLPDGWHTSPISELLAGAHPPVPRRGRALETNVVLRAVAIIAIVGSHANLFALVGGAHVLLALAGFNFGRFHLTEAVRTERVRHVAGSVARVAVPSILLIGLFASWTPGLGWRSALLLNGLLGPREWTEPAWHYWFVEALVATLLAMTVLLAVPAVDRLERRWPFWLPMSLAALGLLTRYDVVQLVGGDEIHRASVVFWLFALGWATVKATSARQRVLVTVAVVATVPGFFGDPWREGVVVAGVLALVWFRSVRVPSWAARPVGVLAGASLYIYLVHWQVYPHLEHSVPWLATVLSLLAGVALWRAAGMVENRRRFTPRRLPVRGSHACTR